MLTSEKRGFRRRRMARTNPARSRRATAPATVFRPAPPRRRCISVRLSSARHSPPGQPPGQPARAISMPSTAQVASGRSMRPRIDQGTESAQASRISPRLAAFDASGAAIAGLPGPAAGLNVDLDEGVRRPPGNDALGHQRPQPRPRGIVQAPRARQSERVLQYAGGPASVRVFHRSFLDRRHQEPHSVARMRFFLDLRGWKDLESKE